MIKIGSVYAGTKYVTLHLVLSNGERDDLDISIAEFIGIQNKLIAAKQKMPPTDAIVVPVCRCNPVGGVHAAFCPCARMV